MADREADCRYMSRALELARDGIGLASPNPCVGAVIVAGSQIVGAGSHAYDGRKHAEVLAIEQARERAKGATLYLNLEPCSHFGRTPPCAEAVIAAGVARVVCAMQDPNPMVAGRGFALLRDAGIEVVTGVMECEARKLNEAFAKWIRTGTPMVTLKSAISLDARIAPNATSRNSRSPFWIVGNAAREHVHKQRHGADAIIVGVNTVATDDPLLTDRSGLPRRRPLLRVVLDSKLRMPVQSKLVETASEDVLVFHSFGNSEAEKALTVRGVRLERVAADQKGLVDLRAVVAKLGELGMLHAIIEGGASVNAAALSSGVVDKLVTYVGPRTMGSAVPWFTCTAAPTRLKHCAMHRFGDDIALEGYIRDPYEI